MIDNTTALSLAYDRLLEAERGPTQDEIDYRAIQIMRGLSDLDIADALMEKGETIRAMVLQGNDHLLGFTLRKAVTDYCEAIAKRELEA